MSKALYGFGGLRFWSESEIQTRDHAIDTLQLSLTNAFQRLNPAWRFVRVEGPILTPRVHISPSYDESDLFVLQAKLGDDDAALRAETTASSYLYAVHLLKSGQARLPLCVWQAGKSFRRELNDGARASELRFNEFWQCEFQLVYKGDTKANIRDCAEIITRLRIRALTGLECRIVPSDRVPDYSEETNDINVYWKGKWREIASISTRKDFPEKECKVIEIAVGLDRIVEVCFLSSTNGRKDEE